MTYSYVEHRSFVFTEPGVNALLVLRDWVHIVGKTTGAFTEGAACNHMAEKLGATNSFDVAACLDYLVEREELDHVTHEGVRGQSRVYAVVRKR